MRHLCVLASGNGSNLQAIIDACESKYINATVSLVITNKDCFALTRAQKHNITHVKYPDPKKTFEHIKTIMNYITSNINNKIKPKDIANSADIHPNYMMNIFKNTLGITVNELIDTLKMEQAYETMRSTKICLDQIIYNSGFLSKTSFYTKFKKHYGYSPHYFRKKYLHNQSPLDKENVFLIS